MHHCTYTNYNTLSFSLYLYLSISIYIYLFVGIPVVITGAENVLNQYNWLYTKNDIELAFVVLLIDTPEVNEIMKTLSKYNEEDIREKQEHISKIALRSQYSIPPDCSRRSLPDPSEIMNTWNPDSKYKDAVDYMLDGFMKHVDEHVFNE